MLVLRDEAEVAEQRLQLVGGDAANDGDKIGLTGQRIGRGRCQAPLCLHVEEVPQPVFVAHMPLMPSEHGFRSFRQSVDRQQRQIRIGQALEILGLVPATQRIAANDRAIATGPDDLEPCPASDRAGVEFIVFAQTQVFVVAQPMPVEEGPADHRFEEAQFPSLHTAPGNVAFDEALEIEKLRIGRKPWGHDFRDIGRRIVPDQHDVVGREIPVCAGEQFAKSAGEKKIVGVQNADEWRFGPGDRGVAGEGGATVDVEADDAKPAAAIIGRLSDFHRIVGGGVVDDDDFRHLRFAQSRCDGSRDCPRRVAGGDDHADLGSCHGLASRLHRWLPNFLPVPMPDITVIDCPLIGCPSVRNASADAYAASAMLRVRSKASPKSFAPSSLSFRCRHGANR
ncbi:hypothetical protein MESS4_110088 [Mesorhizobium sp. STM 4661]|nr:hypothetical protein MESS4_110088 [Mesorhizobium sp. STM 4661]